MLFGVATFGITTFAVSISSTEGALVGLSLRTGSPAFGAPTFGQTHVLDAASIAIGGPVFGTPALSQTNACVADPFRAGGPIFGAPELYIIITCYLSGAAYSEMVSTTPFVASMEAGEIEVAFAADIELRSL